MAVYKIKRDKNGKVKSMKVDKKRTKKFNSWVKKNKSKKSHHSSSRSSSSKSSSSRSSSSKLNIKKNIFGNDILQSTIPKTTKKETKTNKTQKVSGSMEAPKKETLWGKFNKFITPSKKDSKLSRGLKGVAKFGTDAAVGTADALKTGSLAAVGNKKAQNKIKGGMIALTQGSTWRNMGSSLGRMVQSNDPYQKTQGLLTIATMVSGPKVSFTKKIKFIDGESKFKSKYNIKTEKNSLIYEKKGISETGEKVISKTNLKQDPKTGEVKGDIVYSINGKKYKQNIHLKDKGGYYQDIKTKKRIAKTSKLPDEIKKDITEIKTKQHSKDSLVIEGKKVYKKSSRTIEKTRHQEVLKKRKTRKSGDIVYDKTTKITKKETQIDYINDLSKKGKKIKPALDVLSIFEKSSKTGKTIASIKGKTKTSVLLDIKKSIKKKGISETEIKNFLKSIDYDKELINGLDKRTRLAKALGLRKNSKKLKTFEMYIKDGLGVKIERKGTITSKGKGKLGGQTSYHAGLNGVSRTKKLTKKELKDLGKIGEKIDIPEIELKIKKLRSIRGLGLIPTSKIDSLIKKLGKKLDKLKKDNEQKPKKENKKDNKKKQENKKNNKKDNKQKQDNKQKPKNSNSNTNDGTSTNLIPPKLDTPKIKFIPKEKLKIPKLEFKTKIPKGYRLSFDILYREKGKVKSLGTKLPLNRALAKATSLIDKTTSASMEIKINGITKLKDSNKPKTLSKFTTRKTINSLKLVEKNKNRIDTKGEKKGLSVSKLLNKGKNKAKSRTKTKKVSKSIKKKKKKA